MRGNEILFVGADKPYEQRVCEQLRKRGRRVSGYVSHVPVHKSSSLASVPWIDCSKLYAAQDVEGAFGSKNYGVLDSDFLRSMSECERLYFMTADRLTAKCISVGAHRVCYRELLRVYKGYFEQHDEIGYVYFNSTPHFGWAIVLYYVARYFSVSTIIMCRTDVDNKCLLRGDWRLPLNFTEEGGAFVANVPVGSVCLGGSDSIYVAHSKKLNNASIDFMRTGGSGFIMMWLRLAYRVLFFKGFVASQSAVFCSGSSNAVEYLLLYINRYIQNKNAWIEYDALSVTPDLGCKYVYYAMHFQPERSTQPEGMEYEDQYLAISIIANSIPDGWSVYVKEHPRQFDGWPPDLRKTHSRYTHIYRQLIALGNVVLVKPDFDSEALIEFSKVVSTVSGSVGWQAINAGKPAIIFSYSWYSSCEGCRVVHSVCDVRRAISELCEESSASIRMAGIKYLKKIAPYLIGYYSIFRSEEDGEYAEYVSGLADAIIRVVDGRSIVL
jgi:hypothetical protein